MEEVRLSTDEIRALLSMNQIPAPKSLEDRIRELEERVKKLEDERSI